MFGAKQDLFLSQRTVDRSECERQALTVTEESKTQPKIEIEGMDRLSRRLKKDGDCLDAMWR